MARQPNARFLMHTGCNTHSCRTAATDGCPGRGVLLSSILRRANMKRIVLAAVAVCLAAAPAFAASPKVDAAIKTFKAVSADPAKVKTFCDMSKVMDAMGEKQD